MSFHIIIRGGGKRDRHFYGRTRTEIDKALVGEGWGSSFASESDRDKCAYLEKKFKQEHTTGGRVFFNQNVVDKLVR